MCDLVWGRLGTLCVSCVTRCGHRVKGVLLGLVTVLAFCRRTSSFLINVESRVGGRESAVRCPGI